MEASQQKRYLINPGFGLIEGMIKTQHLDNTGSCEVCLPFISGNHPTDPTVWWRVFDFSRTAAVALRHMMLKGTGLLQFYNPSTSSPAKERNDNTVTRSRGQDINCQSHFAKNKQEAVTISGHFDSLFPHNLLGCQLNGIAPGEIRVRSLTRELIVVDTCHYIMWKIVASLQVKGQIVASLQVKELAYKFEAIPTLTVNRYECKSAGIPDFLPDVGPHQKQYFVKTDPMFWSNVERMKMQLCPVITGSCEVCLPFISGNHPTDPTVWLCVFDFSRTAAVALRHMMLKGTGLLQFCNSSSSSPAKERNDNTVIRSRGQGINCQSHFAKNKQEAVAISGHFDSLFPHNLLECKLNGIAPGQIRSLTGELIVVDTCHNNIIIWQIVVSLQVRRLDGWIRFDAVPTVAVIRHESQIPNFEVDLAEATAALHI